MSQQQLFDIAVQIVSKEISPDSAKIIQYAIEHNKSESFGVENGSFGMAFRNLLAERGLVWEESALFSVWSEVLERAVVKILE